MAQASDIRPHQEVLGSDGVHVGTVDHVEGDRIKLARKDSADGVHHYLPLSSVARVDDKVHLTTTGAMALSAAGVASSASGTTAENGPLPPIHNPAVPGAPARGNYYLPWILGIIGILLLLLLLRSCFHKEPVATTAETVPPATTPATPPLPVEAVKLPDGRTLDLEPNTLNYDLQRYLASSEATPKTFQFDKLNFDTASAAIRTEDRPNVDALAQILAAYPKARVRIAGYTDARGSTEANAQLGQQRADAVAAALAAKGIAQDRVTAVSGGESTPTDTNATAEGQFENRRTELVVTDK